MFTCNFCGYESNSDNAKFCATCGPDGPSATWKAEEVDTRENVERLALIVTSLLSAEPSELAEQIANLRSRLKISYPVWMKIREHFDSYQNGENGSWPIAVYFKYDAENAFALGDTLIEFEIKNLTKTQFFNAAITWDDPETERLDLQASTRKFISPNTSASVGAAVIFDRPGQKEINDLRITISDETGNTRTFRADGFKVIIRNPSVSIQNTVNTTNTISIEGRGVVDAQGFGSQTEENSDNNLDEKMRWEPIEITPAIDPVMLADSIVGPCEPVGEIRHGIVEELDGEPNAGETHIGDKKRQTTREEIQAAFDLIEWGTYSPEFDETDPGKPQYTSSLFVKIPNPAPLKEARISYFVSEGDEVEWDANCCTISVGDIHKVIDFIGGGLVIHTLDQEELQRKLLELENSFEDEIEIATTLNDGLDHLELECVEYDGSIFLQYAPHNLKLTLEAVEGTAYGHVGTARAQKFGWSIPLVVNDGKPDLRKIKQVMNTGSQINPGTDSDAIARLPTEKEHEGERQKKLNNWIMKQDRVLAERRLNEPKKRKKWFG